MEETIEGAGRHDGRRDPSPPAWLDVPMGWMDTVPGQPDFVTPEWFSRRAGMSRTAARRLHEGILSVRRRRDGFLDWWPTMFRPPLEDLPWLLARACLERDDSVELSRIAHAVLSPRQADESGLFQSFFDAHREGQGIVIPGLSRTGAELAFARTFEMGAKAGGLFLSQIFAGSYRIKPMDQPFLDWFQDRWPESYEDAEVRLAGMRGVSNAPEPQTSVETPGTRSSEVDVEALLSALADRDATIEVLRARLEELEARLSTAARRDEGPTTHRELIDWVRNGIGESIVVLPRAVRSLRKATDVDVRRLVRGLSFLRDVYVPWRSGLVSDAASVREALVDSGFDEGPSFSSPGSLEAFHEYAAPWRCRTIRLDRHLKRGIGNATSTMIRIYFHWDEVERTLVVGHMPGHLPNWRKS